MAAASYHPRILIPKYGQTDSVKPLTANRGFRFAVRLYGQASVLKSLMSGGNCFFFPLKFDNCYANQNTHQNIKAKSNDHLIEKNFIYIYILKHRGASQKSFYNIFL